MVALGLRLGLGLPLYGSRDCAAGEQGSDSTAVTFLPYLDHNEIQQVCTENTFQ
jgi:hypothetical protein